MSVDKFKFVSPGVFVAEVDNSQLPEEPRGVGPVIIGRSLKGPALRPVQVNSFSDFVETFGNPIFGAGSSDVWRDGPNVSAPHMPLMLRKRIYGIKVPQSLFDCVEFKMNMRAFWAMVKQDGMLHLRKWTATLRKVELMDSSWLTLLQLVKP